jgi:hypothetical protein
MCLFKHPSSISNEFKSTVQLTCRRAENANNIGSNAEWLFLMLICFCGDNTHLLIFCHKIKGMWQMVISHCRESLDWVSKIGVKDIVVYTKCGVKPNYSLPYRWIQCKNVGREAETFVRHIFQNYNHLAAHTVFLQGDPNHGNTLYQLDHLIRNQNWTSSDLPCRLLGISSLTTATSDGCPNHCGIAVKSTCQRILQPENSKLCDPPYKYTPGGQFVLTRKGALHIRRDRYHQILSMLRSEERYKRRDPLYP